ncbi:junctional adhesion molecule B [Spea bombifrons]|uniref:junctional adhesion molecule B n=1 Tax=Spea bombifrons TaxID=233779 RepID=UPI00234AED8E|nr:junctional adhesion molecule B [Spea bombifrons]
MKMSPPAWVILALGYFVALCCKNAFGVTVTSDNTDVKVIEFGEVILSCKYRLEKEQTVRLEWKKVSYNGDISFVYFNKSLAGNLQTRAEMMDSSIRIRNVTRSDSGKYRCEVSAPQDKKNFQEILIELNILVAPSVPVCDIPSSAMSGTVVELKCKESEGYPASQYKWYKNGVLLDHPGPNSKAANISYRVNEKTGTLQFNTVTKDDSGEYYCEANNSIGKAQRCIAKKMQVDDLNIPGIIAATVIVALVILLCGCGVFFAHKRGYFSRGKPSEKERSDKYTSKSESDFKHTKSFVI